MSPKRGIENTVDAGLNPAARGKLWQNAQPRRNYEAMRKGSSAGHLFGRLKGESSAPPGFNVVTNIRGRKPQVERSYLREFIEGIAKDRRTVQLSDSSKCLSDCSHPQRRIIRRAIVIRS